MMIRSFFAIDLPQATKIAIQDLILDLQMQIKHIPVHWVQPNNLHLTLQFLAQVRMTDIPALVENVRAEIKSIPSFHLQLGYIELFPSLSRPKVISLAIEPQETLAILSAAIGRGILSTGYAIETRPFRGHITLGRITFHKTFSLPDIHLQAFEKISIHKIVLFDSKPQSSGQKYTPLAEISLRD